jgi:hypothetical protein
MKSLRDYLSANGIDEVQAMNLLQDHGIISDECVSVDDVVDSGKALTWLNDNRNLLYIKK